MTVLVRALAIVCMLTAVGAAQPAPPPADPKVEAKRLFDEATEHYKLAEFTQALAGYEKAYALFKAPAFLFNIAQCHFQLQTWDRAIFFFESYLREQPDASNRTLVEDLMREARERQAAARQAEQRKLDLEKERLELEKRESEHLAKELELQTASLVAPTEPPVYKKWWFWSIVGGVAVATIATTVAVTTRDTVLPSGSLGTVDQR
ncbi:MAG TPA: tetratricopeptide repeat protein [Kofleriaceae bacterium]|nr:tetratricopeptide repeat protein [Kofleriaceae bacterium]